jgi:hypothetical protein
MPVLPFGEGKSSFGARPSSKERQCGSQPKFKNAWRIATAAKLGCDKVHNQIERVLATMKLCNNMDDFREKFARVFKKPYAVSLFDFNPPK